METNDKEKKRFTKVTIGLLTMSVIGLMAIIAVEARAQSPDFPSLVHDIFLSVFCSVIASAIFSFLQAAVSRDEQEELRNLKQTVNGIQSNLHEDIAGFQKSLEDVSNKLRMQNDLYDSGIISIRKKSYYDPFGKFWKDIIELSSERLDLIGHSISKWFDDEFKETFVSKVKQMIMNKAEVRIILSGEQPDFNKIHQAERKGGDKTQLNKIEKTCYELRQIVKAVPKSVRGQLRVYITDPSRVTYMYIRTDQQCFISPYISSVTNSSNAFLLELAASVEYSRCFDLDFNEMIERRQDMIDLEK